MNCFKPHGSGGVGGGAGRGGGGGGGNECYLLFEYLELLSSTKVVTCALYCFLFKSRDV